MSCLEDLETECPELESENRDLLQESEGYSPLDKSVGRGQLRGTPPFIKESLFGKELGPLVKQSVPDWGRSSLHRGFQGCGTSCHPHCAGQRINTTIGGLQAQEPAVAENLHVHLADLWCPWAGESSCLVYKVLVQDPAQLRSCLFIPHTGEPSPYGNPVYGKC